jgi:hypothetical protein
MDIDDGAEIELCLKTQSPIESTFLRPTMDMYIKEMPTDWRMLLAVITAAFIGSGFAYLLTVRFENIREQSRQSVAVNLTLSILASNITRLLNFKEQFLSKFNAEFKIALEHAGRYQPANNSTVLLEEYRTKISPMLAELVKQDGQLNGLLIKWDAPNFSPFPELDKLAFVMEHSPKSIIDIDRASDALGAIPRLCEARNIAWKSHERTLASQKSEHSHYMLALYDLTSYRFLLLESADTAIDMLMELTEMVGAYIKVVKQRRFSRMKKYKFVKFTIPETKKWLFPNPTKFEKYFVPAKDADSKQTV